MGEEHSEGTPWGKIIGITCAVLLVLGGGCAAAAYFGFNKAMDAGKVQGLTQQQNQVLNNLESDDAKEALSERFNTLLTLAKEKKLSLGGFTVVTQAVNFAYMDQKISDEESQLLIKYFDKVLEKNGDVSVLDPETNALIQDMQREIGSAK